MNRDQIDTAINQSTILSSGVGGVEAFGPSLPPEASTGVGGSLTFAVTPISRGSAERKLLSTL